jgi:hypothetical protein
MDFTVTQVEIDLIIGQYSGKSLNDPPHLNYVDGFVHRYYLPGGVANHAARKILS